MSPLAQEMTAIWETHLVCRGRRLDGAVLYMRPQKPSSCVISGVARYIKIPSSSKGAAQRPKFCNLSLKMVTAEHKRKTLKWLFHVLVKFPVS